MLDACFLDSSKNYGDNITDDTRRIPVEIQFSEILLFLTVEFN